MKRSFAFLVTAALLACAAPVFAQQMGPGTYNDTSCGSWVNDVWVPNGSCTTGAYGRLRHGHIAGTITQVNGHLVTVQMSGRTMVINDQPALNRRQSGKVANGRQIVAYGFWRDGTFYATAIY